MVPSIGTKAFAQDETFMMSGSEYTLNDGTLYMPNETLLKYKSTAGWKEFRHIVGNMSTGIEDINSEEVTIQANGGALAMTTIVGRRG